MFTTGGTRSSCSTSIADYLKLYQLQILFNVKLDERLILFLSLFKDPFSAA
jgi:hypothetical protein